MVDLKDISAIATVIGVESFPCSMLGQKKLYTLSGNGQTGNLLLPWKLPATWIEEQLAELVLGSGFQVAELANPDEPDQIIKIMLDPWHDPGPCTGYRETLHKAVSAAYTSLPAALATVINSGHTSCQAGTKVLVYGDGQEKDRLGCQAEAELRRFALAAIEQQKPRMHKIYVAADAEKGACGEVLEVFIEPVSTFMPILK